MRILLFTHKSDIDGLGNVVLAKLAFEEVDYVLTETYNLQTEILDYLEKGKLYTYDKIFITDLWLESPALTKVANDQKLNNKIFVFDHHKSALKTDYKKYSFIILKISNEFGLCSGTSLFYEYLIQNKYLKKENTIIYEFSELTRKYDTWEWITKYQDNTPRELTLLFETVGSHNYIDFMIQKLSNNPTSKFSFTELETLLIKNKIKQVRFKIENYAKKVIYKEIMGKKAGIVFIDYEYRNDLAEYFRQNKFDMDFAMLIALDDGSISLRSIKEDIDVSVIAEKMGGRGHPKAAGKPIFNKQKEKIIECLLESKTD